MNHHSNQRIALLIGASDGIGKETAVQLCDKGYFVVAVGRNQQKLARLKALLHENVDTIQSDISLMSEVRRVSNYIKANYSKLDVIIHTADVLLTKRQETAEGNELTMATSYLSRFLFNEILSDLLRKGEQARIIHVAAAGMPLKLKKTDFPLPATASSFKGHTIAALANDVYGLTFARKTPAIRINVLNPGMVDTDIRRNMQGNLLTRTLMGIMGVLVKATKVEDYTKLVVEIATGIHAISNDFVLIDSKGRGISPKKDKLDSEMQEYVWSVSKQLTQSTQLFS